MREETSFPSGDGTCAAWLYRPDDGHPRARPAVVLGHGLGGTRAMRLAAYAERFVAAGYVCLVLDYRHFGDSSGEPRQLLSVRRQLEDWRAAVAHVRGLEGVDADRVVVWGTSFGGGHAISLAAEDHRLAAAIAQCPFTDGVASALAVPPTTSVRLTAVAVADRVRGALGRAPAYRPAAGEPGTTAFMTSHDALPGITSLAEGATVDDRLTARSLFDVLRYAPGRRASRVRCPLLVALCASDTVAPSGRARRQVSRAPRAEVLTYPVGHFEIYLGEPFETAVAAYLDFLRRHVPVGRAG
ncbi:alpha/beta hydrolase [Nocardioides sp. CFH 31398]|uniref:alpha/beta hydrolase n=1 Tax=Nocardioides sp. CFH 31398 TaxID=2919579 RepID=UPI001F06597C|nr:alpha/beta hydrolase [Nocardioides sp. CFH 31398]MCH1866544.1 alpha/beta hydrolase [Nocardioides sp. CFH 31398]